MSESIAPRSIIIPEVDTSNDGKKGNMGLSGADLVYFDGTSWVKVNP